MSKESGTPDAVVIGGGLAGLAAAALLGRAGLCVEVIERSADLGGRARTSSVGGFFFNRGPHALYRKGEGMRVLRELGVPVSGGVPPSRGHALFDGELYRLPADPLSLLATGLFSWAEKASAARWLAAIPRLAPDELASDSVRSWLDRTGMDTRLRNVVEAYLRLSTYTNAPDVFSARTAVAQLKRATGGVVYVDNGWQTLVDDIAERAVRSGVTIQRGIRAESIERLGDGYAVRTEGRSIAARAVVIATTPYPAAELIGALAPETARALSTAEPVRIATLDVALAKLPRPEPRFILGVDQPLYYSVHSSVAKFGPEGGALIHVGKYLAPGPSDAASDRAELEALLELAQPGWLKEVVHVQYLPSMHAAERLDLASQRGAEGRPDTEVPGLDGVYFAGDWVKSDGWLADASLASARNAADLVLRRSPARAVA